MQSKELLLKEIENRFLTKKDLINKKKLLILCGDYSSTSQMRGTLPVPNVGFKKLLSRRFQMLEINEYNTSRIYNKNFKELESVTIKKKKHKKRLHEILTLKDKNERPIFVNRDCNACKNILLLGKHFLNTQTRHIQFCRKP